jgi:DNA-binding XRE family transcriptional regulator
MNVICDAALNFNLYWQVIMHDVGTKIREAREARQMSQAALAKEIKASQQAIDRIERGITTFSRVVPQALSFLGLDNHPAHKTSHSADHDILSVFATNADEIDETVVGHERRPMCLVNVHGAYAIQQGRADMAPVYNLGDVLLVNPQRPARAGDRIVLRNGRSYVVASLIEEMPDEWVVATNAATRTIAKEAFPLAHKIVGCVTA